MAATIDKIDPPRAYKAVNRHVIPLETLIAYGEKGLTLEEIGRITGISKQAVQQRFERAEYTPARLKDYKAFRSDIFAHLQSVILNSLTPSEIKRIPPGQRLMAFGILYDKERLERGQSTSNIQSLSVIIEQAHKAKKAQPVVSPVEETATSGAIPINAEDVQPIKEGEDAVQGQRRKK